MDISSVFYDITDTVIRNVAFDFVFAIQDKLILFASKHNNSLLKNETVFFNKEVGILKHKLK